MARTQFGPYGLGELMARIMTDEDDCRFEGRHVRFSDDAFIHMRHYRTDAWSVCDMLKASFECPERKKQKGVPFRPDSKRVCAERNGKIFSIVLDVHEHKNGPLWSVSHFKPI